MSRPSTTIGVDSAALLRSFWGGSVARHESPW
jgi:hypothetical protein